MSLNMSKNAWIKLSDHRSSCPEVFCKKGVLENFTKFTGKHLCQILFLNKVASLRPATLLKKRLWHGCFSDIFFYWTPPLATSVTIPMFSIWLIILDIWRGFEYASAIKNAEVLNKLRYSYSNIIIVTNIGILELSSVRFLHPGAPQITVPAFLTWVRRYKNSESL